MVYQVIVKLLDGKSRIFRFPTPSVSAVTVKSCIRSLTHIPNHDQRLVSNSRQFHDDDLIPFDGVANTVYILLNCRLRGGKGGFGSLLRGAATKAGQKKTNNFDACRDMSGRRLRHVNAEKRMEEWRAEAEERRLEKIAEDFIKKKAKVARKDGGKGGDAATEKYVEKYRVDSAKCREEVEKSVRELLAASGKRKKIAVEATGSDSKRLKIWMGKRKLGESDTDDTDEDDSDSEAAEENDKSVVIDCTSHFDSNKEEDGSSDSVSSVKLNVEFLSGCSSESGSEKEMISIVNGKSESFEIPNEGSPKPKTEGNGPNEPALGISRESIIKNIDFLLETADIPVTEATHAEIQESNKTEPLIVDQIAPSRYCLGEGGASAMQINGNAEQVIHEETGVASTRVPESEKPLNFEEFSSASDMEVLGMERLKSELQEHGLKCGGTLQERAARLFLLKTTPLEMLPKKLLAKK